MSIRGHGHGSPRSAAAFPSRWYSPAAPPRLARWCGAYLRRAATDGGTWLDRHLVLIRRALAAISVTAHDEVSTALPAVEVEPGTDGCSTSLLYGKRRGRLTPRQRSRPINLGSRDQ